MALNRVSTDPRLPFGADARLVEVLREQAQAINTATLLTPKQITATATLGEGDQFVIFKAAGTATITLPAPARMTGKRITIQRGDSNTGTITIAPASGNINGGASVTMTTAYQRREIVSDGVDYWSA
jgi:hypothetical protein